MKKLCFTFFAIIFMVIAIPVTSVYAHEDVSTEETSRAVDSISRRSPFDSIIDVKTFNKEPQPRSNPNDDYLNYQFYAYNNSIGQFVVITLRCKRSTISTINGNEIFAYSFVDDLPAWLVTQDIQETTNAYPNAILLDEPTHLYNCHSYAWYNRYPTNRLWMNDYPNIYYSAQDMSYAEVATPRIGDIICYYKSNGENIHSGVVVEVLNGTSNGVCGNSNLVMIESKWGSAGLYRHRGDQCPYPGLEATYVKYYRPRTGSSYTLNQSMSDKTLNKTINANGGIVDRYEMYELNVTVAGYYDFVVSSDAEPRVRLFENNYSDVSFPRVKFENHTKWFTKYFTVGTYYLRIEYMDETRSGNIITTMKTHSEHIYQCKPINDTHHIDKCECGVTQGAPSMHVIVTPTALLPPGLRSWCGYCGYLLPPNGNYPIITV